MPRWNKAIGIMVGMAVMFAASAPAQNSTKSSKLTIEQLIEIKHPSNPVWSPDGKQVVFTWDRAGVGNLYVANADGHGQPQALTSFPEGQVEGAFWNEDGDTVYFPHDGDLWQVPVSVGTPKPVWSKQDRGMDIVPSPDSRRVAFVRGNPTPSEGTQRGSDLIIRWLSDGTESTVAHNDVSIRGIVWSPDGASIAYTGGSKIIYRRISAVFRREAYLSNLRICARSDVCVEARGQQTYRYRQARRVRGLGLGRRNSSRIRRGI